MPTCKYWSGGSGLGQYRYGRLTGRYYNTTNGGRSYSRAYRTSTAGLRRARIGVNIDNFSVRGGVSKHVDRTHASRRFPRRRPGLGQRVQLTTTGRRTRDPNTSGTISLIAGTRYTITVEYYEAGGQSEIRLRWLPPGNTSYVIVPASQLYGN